MLNTLQVCNRDAHLALGALVGIEPFGDDLALQPFIPPGSRARAAVAPLLGWFTPFELFFEMLLLIQLV